MYSDLLCISNGFIEGGVPGYAVGKGAYIYKNSVFDNEGSRDCANTICAKKDFELFSPLLIKTTLWHISSIYFVEFSRHF